VRGFFVARALNKSPSPVILLFVTIVMIYVGFQSIDPNKIKLDQILGATRAQILTKIILPGSVPVMIAALKVSAGLSLVGVVVGEFQSANIGLGYLIQYGSQNSPCRCIVAALRHHRLDRIASGAPPIACKTRMCNW
jgi:ABC-type nitrate/sulfonate/bicarbonate transport system permease component